MMMAWGGTNSQPGVNKAGQIVLHSTSLTKLFIPGLKQMNTENYYLQVINISLQVSSSNPEKKTDTDFISEG